jgi:alpha-1,2-mannosyltransferase
VTRRSTLLLATIAAAFIVVNGINAIRKGGDFTVFLDAGQRCLRGVPMYAESGVGGGVVGPPFQGVFFAPLALLGQVDSRLARLVWYGLNLGALAFAAWAWTAALAPVAGRAVRWQGWLPTPLGPVVAALLAVVFPLQTNFEHQNMNPVLLALTGAAALALARGRDTAGGVAIGVATALKVFPGLLLVYLLIRKRWKASVAGALTAGALTLLPVLQYGPEGMASEIRDWLAISAGGGWPIRGNNQSLFAMLARAFRPDGAFDTGHLLAADHPRIHLAWLAIASALAALTLLVSSPWRVRSERAAPAGIAAVLGLAVVLSPIAWDHYWVLMFPAFLLLTLAREGHPWTRWVFWPALILTSGFSRATVGVHGLSVARALSVFTWAGLLLLAATLILQDSLARRVRSDEGLNT